MLKSLIIKIIAFIMLNLFVKRNKINSEKIRTALVNRTDRLGDAIISLPLLVELNKRFEITVLTSQYNDAVLRRFLTTKVVINNPISLSEAIKIFFINLISLNHSKQKDKMIPKYDLYLDLIGVRGLKVFLMMKKENMCHYYIGFNMALWSWFLDYAYKGSVELSKKNIVDGSLELINESLGIKLDVPDYLDLSSEVIKPKEFNLEPPYILVNISGFNKFRGLSPKMYALLINSLEFKGNVVVMDEPNRPNFKEFKKYVNRDKIFYLDKNYSIWELLYISRGSFLYIGSDLGITHILQLPTNCIIFFATGSHTAWRPYSRNLYQRRKIGKMVIEETKNSVSLIKKIIYRPVWCRPCYDIGCRKYRCIADMNIKAISDEINASLHSLEYGNPRGLIADDKLC